MHFQIYKQYMISHCLNDLLQSRLVQYLESTLCHLEIILSTQILDQACPIGGYLSQLNIVLVQLLLHDLLQHPQS